MDIRLRSGDGTYRWHLVTSARDVDASGQQVWYGLAVDIDDHKRAELALRESERRLRAILDGEPECVKIISAGGSLIEMNDAGLAMIEADRLEDVAGADVAQLVHPDDREIFRQLHRAAAAGEKAEARFRIIGLRGTQRWLESTSVPLARDDDVCRLEVEGLHRERVTTIDDVGLVALGSRPVDTRGVHIEAHELASGAREVRVQPRAGLGVGVRAAGVDEPDVHDALARRAPAEELEPVDQGRGRKPVDHFELGEVVVGGHDGFGS